MTATSLERIDWSDDEYFVNDSISVDLTSDDISNRSELIKMIIRGFESSEEAEHYVYCFSFRDGDSWYVGETANLYNRFATHLREKDVKNLELVETVPDRESGRERERELSYEMAINKGSTEIYGGR